LYSKLKTDVATEIPLCLSISIKSMSRISLFYYSFTAPPFEWRRQIITLFCQLVFTGIRVRIMAKVLRFLISAISFGDFDTVVFCNINFV